MLKLFVLSLALGCALAGLAGGRQKVDVNNEAVKSMADFAVSYLNGLSDRIHDVTISNIINAEEQVVSGMNYFLTIEVTKAGCTLSCQSEICQVTVFDQPWTQTRSVSQSQCMIKRPRGEPLVGGTHTISVDSKEVRDASQFAIMALNKMTNSMYASSLVEIKSAESQVVAGIRFNLEFQIRQTKCRNGPQVDLTQCAFDTNSPPKTCHVSVVWQAWMDPKYTLLDGAKCV